ncbi:MAG: hypothetical protein Q8N36_06210 [bacterium]|nr:hypothetical protein [bacterium]
MKEKFLALIQNALDAVDQEYYAITPTYAPLGIVRERVFCYEYYHQMRLIQKEDKLTEFSIHGEVDKRGYRLFDPDARRNPDFIFHIPGSMNNNMVVIEVKGKIGSRYKRSVFKDIQTLSRFTNTQHMYHLGLLIIYNYSLQEFKQRFFLEYIKQRVENECLEIDRIIVLCKKDHNHPVELEYLSSILNGVSKCQN